jgi:hypothetical protein
MDEKTHQTEAHQNELTATSPLPPCYDSAIQTPPPPSYSQSTTRLYYKNQPYISDIEQATFNNPQTAHDYDSETWSYIGRLPLYQRLQYYVQSWATTLYDGRLVFFIFFVLASVVTLGLAVSFITIPSLINR